jgi:crossover junction endodeoxyribonuclease RuvC
VGVFIGIDPGKKGAVAVIGKMTGSVECLAMPPDGHTLAEFLTQAAANMAFVEKAQAMPKQGVSSMFNYGTGYGRILGILETLKVPYHLVTPRTWQKKVIPGAKKGKAKEAALIRARQLFPDRTFIPKGCRKPHDGMIDAALIAWYGWSEHARY